MQRIERPRSLGELVYTAIRDEIVSGELQMGDALSEARIASRLEVSRTPVREAFARLELEGLVTTEPQRGTFVFTMGPEALRQICDTRVCLETFALRLGFETHLAGLRSALAAIVAEMTAARAAGEDRRYLQLDTQFHQALVAAAGNPFLADAYQTIASKMAALRNRLGAHPGHMAKSFAEHRRIVELLAAADLPGALETLTDHIGRKEGSYWNT